MKDENGKPVGLIGSFSDITERKQTEGELLKISERLELAMDAGEHGFWDWNLDTNDVYFSPSYYTMLGYEPGELPMELETWINLMSPDDKKTIVPKVENCVKNARTYEVEFRLKTKDGNWKWISGKGKSFKKDIDGIPHRALGVHIDITERKQAGEQLLETMESLRKAVSTTIQVMVSAVEARDPYTAGHQRRVADLARAIATEMGLPKEKIEGIRMAASIHDIGKLSIPAEILSKPTKPSDIEFSLIKEHPRKGYEMLKDVESPWPLAEIVYQHHERMDGSGYPRNLKGDAILMEARIMAVADVVEAMASHRPYRPALGVDAALEEIEDNKGTLYDAHVVDVCLRLFREKGYQLQS
jgi:PAS domain S-box-containing protein/putative nucleotidyltransferase with HDIG domain